MYVWKWKGSECVHHVTAAQSGDLFCFCPPFWGHLEDVLLRKVNDNLSFTRSLPNYYIFQNWLVHLDPSLGSFAEVFLHEDTDWCILAAPLNTAMTPAIRLHSNVKQVFC